MTIGVRQVAIYRHDLPSTAWQLLWWLICKMVENKEIKGGWRIAAAKDMKRDRIWIGKCSEHLQKANLIDTAPGRRYVKVLSGNIVG